MYFISMANSNYEPREKIKPVVASINWEEVNKDISLEIKKAGLKTKEYASKMLDNWVESMRKTKLSMSVKCL
jgi:hypothetical protein